MAIQINTHVYNYVHNNYYVANVNSKSEVAARDYSSLLATTDPVSRVL